MSAPVERRNIGIFGRVNSGKSTLMNLITQEETSIVDSHPGTTADTRKALMEIHGLGPIALYDTAGADEGGCLGEKKKKKVLAGIEESDLVLLMIDSSSEVLDMEEEILKHSRLHNRRVCIVYNDFRGRPRRPPEEFAGRYPFLKFLPFISLEAVDTSARGRLIDFMAENLQDEKKEPELLPFLKRDRFYALIIPMDVETPSGRLLRPQAMVEEYIIRNWAWPAAYRLDLSAARSPDPGKRDAELRRFFRFMESLGNPAGVITDSQAIEEVVGMVEPGVLLTSFSIVMINYFSRGNLSRFADGMRTLETLNPGDRVLVVEACTHSRIGEDIGTVQIPGLFEQLYPGVILEHSFGKELFEIRGIEKYSLLIHCGACMLSSQKLGARMRDLDAAGVPYTNYGLFLAGARGDETLERVLEPWGISNRKEKE